MHRNGCMAIIERGLTGRQSNNMHSVSELPPRQCFITIAIVYSAIAATIAALSDNAAASAVYQQFAPTNFTTLAGHTADHHHTPPINSQFTVVPSNGGGGNSVVVDAKQTTHHHRQQYAAEPAAAVAASAYTIMDLADRFDAHLQQIRDTELALPVGRQMFDAIDFMTIARNDTKTVAHMADKLAAKLQRAGRLINETRRSMRTVLDGRRTDELSAHIQSVVWPLLCPLDAGTADMTTKFVAAAVHYDRNSIEIINYDAASTSTLPPPPPSSTEQLQPKKLSTAVINRRIADTWRQIANTSAAAAINMHQFYFVSRDDVADVLPSNNIQSCRRRRRRHPPLTAHLRRQFIAAIRQKHVYLLIDCGGSPNTDQMRLTRQFAGAIIDQLRAGAVVRLVVVTVADGVRATAAIPVTGNGSGGRVLRQHIARLTETNGGIGAGGTTNHSRGFAYAFDLLREREATVTAADLPMASAGAVPMLVYVSRGLLSPLTEAKKVLATIADGQRQLRQPVIINACAIVWDEKRVMYEKQFLRDVAVQNYSKYGIDVGDWWRKSLAGELFVVKRPAMSSTTTMDGQQQLNKIQRFDDAAATDAADMVRTAAAVFARWFRKRFLSVHQVISRPELVHYADEDNSAVGPVVVVALTQTVDETGVIGIDLFLSDLAEDVIYYTKYTDSYAFICELTTGSVMWHPAYDDNSVAAEAAPHITKLERSTAFASRVYRRMVGEQWGNVTIDYDRPASLSTMSMDEDGEPQQVFMSVCMYICVCVSSFYYACDQYISGE